MTEGNEVCVGEIIDGGCGIPKGAKVFAAPVAQEVDAEVVEIEEISPFLAIKEEILEKKLANAREKVPHRELGLAVDGVLNALKVLEGELKTVAAVEADIKARAEKAKAKKPKK